ncbi:MAG: hypothetical protein ABFR05_01010 [Bacteroidota bacterium]
MNELTKFYERAKQSAKDHMKKGQINAYYQDLKAMNHYKRLLESA